MKIIKIIMLLIVIVIAMSSCVSQYKGTFYRSRIIQHRNDGTGKIFFRHQYSLTH